jgi:NAD(P)-dependent dehydrogenase (short-subunit alcohol dehydrogenase family)
LIGKKALIVGGAGRIGRCVARAFLENGAEVLLVDRDAESLRRTGEALAREWPQAAHTGCLQLDTGAGSGRLAEMAREVLGGVDVLVNCPGGIYRAPFLEHSLEELDRLFRLNVGLVFAASQAVVPLMIPRGGGKIINFAAVGGTRPERDHAGYCAAKAALIALSRVMALELAVHRIQVNVVAPGPTETVPFTSPYYREHPEVLRAIEAATPAGRIGHPEDHAGLVVFLASDRSDWITGQVVLSDGGRGLV